MWHLPVSGGDGPVPPRPSCCRGSWEKPPGPTSGGVEGQGRDNEMVPGEKGSPREGLKDAVECSQRM